jgi:uncharacterized protein (DUF305 family)
MLNARRKISIILVGLLLAACGQDSQQSEEQAHRQRDAELAQSLANEATADPTNPFGPAQTLAEDSIGAAVGADIDQTWVQKMIEHQEGSARFAAILLKAKPSIPAERAAQRVAQDAHARVKELKALRSGSLRTNQDSADVFGGATSDIFARMTQVQAPTVEQTWARKMVEYDRGAVALAGIEATRGKDARIRSFARELASSLANEAETLERLSDRAP